MANKPPPISGAALLGAVERRHAQQERVTPLGLLNYARAYAEAGIHLHATKLVEGHRDAPIDFLLMHSIELYLESFLRVRGESVKGLVRLRHNYGKIARKAEAHGLVLDDEDRYVIEIMEHTRAWSRSRYIETGFRLKASAEALIRTCRSFDQLVSDAIRKEGDTGRSNG
jgi:hypothetical protein